MSSDKGGKEGTVAKAAGIAVATGIGWSIIKALTSKKGQVALPQASSGDQKEFDGPLPVKKEGYDNDDAVIVVEEEAIIIEERSPPSNVEKEAQIDVKDNEKAPNPEPPKPDAQTIEKPWFFFGGGKKNESRKECKPETIPSKSYDIQKGDTLWGISRKYSVTLESLKAANNLSKDEIYAGDKLVIPPK